MSKTFGEQEAFTRGVNGDSLTGAETHSERMEYQRGVDYQNGVISESDTSSNNTSYYSPEIVSDETNSSKNISSFELGWQLHTLVVKYGAKSKRGHIAALIIFLEAIIGGFLVPFGLSKILPLNSSFFFIFGVAYIVWYIYSFRQKPGNKKMVYIGPLTLFFSNLIFVIFSTFAISVFDNLVGYFLTLLPYIIAYTIILLVTIRINSWYVDDRNGIDEPREKAA